MPATPDPAEISEAAPEKSEAALTRVALTTLL
jgi:hypothetical protein